MEQMNLQQSNTQENVTHEIPMRDNLQKSLNELREVIQSNPENSFESWEDLAQQMKSLGFIEKNTEEYLSSVVLMHGAGILVRRADLAPVFSSLENASSFKIKHMDTEPNAALLGGIKKEKNGLEISGIEAALSGGFGWVVQNKVAGVYGFTTEHSQLKVAQLPKDSLSLSKKYGEIMRGVEGEVSAEDVVFFLLRIHKSAYPESLCRDEDFDDLTGERKPFVLRLYAKNHQAH